MKLSILIPSKRPSLLQQFIKSLEKNAHDFSQIELVILEDSNGEHLMYRDGNTVRILHPKIPYISELLYECYSNSSASWIMFGNDDLIMETKDWDLILDKAFKVFDDQIALFYPNDTIFGQDFPCFPIVSRKVLEESNFFPLPNYRRYKVDDSLIQIMPAGRIVYIPSITLRHLNVVEDSIENPMSNKWGYKLDEKTGEQDHETFVKSLPQLKEIRSKLESLITVNK